MWRAMIGPRGTPLVLSFFKQILNKMTNAKSFIKCMHQCQTKKKCRDQSQNWMEVQRLNTHLNLNNMIVRLWFHVGLIFVFH